MKEYKNEYSNIQLGGLTHRLFLRVALRLKKGEKKEVIKYLLDDFREEKTREEFKKFLKSFPEFPKVLDKKSKKARPLTLIGDQVSFIENTMRDFNFRFRSRFFQYLIYFHYNNLFDDFDSVMSREKNLRLIPEESAFKKRRKKYQKIY